MVKIDINNGIGYMPTNGYTCERCGQWVSWNESHICYVTGYYDPYYYYPYYYYPCPDERFYKLLEDIRDLLKELKEKN